MKTFTNILRYIAVIPVTIILITLLYKLLGYTALKLFDLSFGKLLLVIIVLGGLIIFLANIISMMVSGIINWISPNKKFSFWVVTLISVISAIEMIYRMWTFDIEYIKELWLISIGYTIITLYMTYTLIITPTVLEER